MSNIGIPYPEEIHKKALEWRIRIEGADVSAEDKLKFKAWLDADIRHQQAYDRAATVWTSFRTLDKGKIGAAMFEPSFLDNIRTYLTDLPNAFKRPKFQIGAIATAVVTMAATALSIPQIFPASAPSETTETLVTTTYNTERGKFLSVTLSDGSALELGPTTEIDVDFSDKRRDIDLIQGSVVFDVASDPNRPFRVSAGNFTATALGTVFDVRNNGGIVRLAVLEGAVEAANPFVINAEPTSMIRRQNIEAGHQIAISQLEGLFDIRPLRENGFAVWRENRLRYVGAPLSELIADANRYSEVPIIIDGGATHLDEITVTFTFNGDDVHSMLRVLPNMFPVEVDQSSNDAILIRAIIED